MICIAVVKIWKVVTHLDQVVDYAEDHNKTNLSNFKDLNDLMDYAMNGDKTEESLYISGINCDPNNATKEMIMIKDKYLKTDGILAWHAYQSFKEGEVTPDEAHKIGLELANEMWGDRFQVVVTTHLNTKHYHNHFVLNSVSFLDGKKYNADRNSYAEFRRLNDLICMEHGKSYLSEKKTKSGINYINYQNRGIKYTNYYKKAKEDLDLAITKASNYESFKNILINLGYDITVRAGKLSIRGKDYKRNIRIERYFGEDYSIDNINKQIKGLYLPETRTYYRNRKPTSILSILSKPKYNSFYSMYIRYCNLLNNYPNYVKKYPLSSNIKEDVKKLDSFSQQAIMLVNNHIETEDNFYFFLNDKVNELSNLKQKREDLWKKYKTVNDNEKVEIKKEIDNISDKIKEVNKEVKMCEDIRLRKQDVENNLKTIEDKEMIIDEHIR